MTEQQEEARRIVKNLASGWSKAIYHNQIKAKSHPKKPFKGKFGTAEYKKPKIL